MATSSFTKVFKLPYNKQAVNSFIELLEKPKEIKIECKNQSSEEEKESREKLFKTLASL